MRRKVAAALAALCLGMAPGYSFADPIEPLKDLHALGWLTGTWQTDSGALEKWELVSAHTLEGAGLNSRGETHETLRIVMMGDEIFYLARPRGSTGPTAFRLVARSSVGSRHELRFENPTHDFPQALTYRAAPGQLEVTVSDLAGKRGFQLQFSRVP